MALTVTDRSRSSVRATVFASRADLLEGIRVGDAIALRACVEDQRGVVALKSSFEGMTTSGVPEADAVAASFRAAPWEASAVRRRPSFVPLTALVSKSAGDRVDVSGVVASPLEVREPADELRGAGHAALTPRLGAVTWRRLALASRSLLEVTPTARRRAPTAGYSS